MLHAADDLLAERGFTGVTIEGIAARAGVAKQTIYRWWSSKVDVLMDTLIEDAGRELTIPTTGSALENTRRYLRRLARFLTGDPAGKVLLALLGEAQHDAHMAQVFHDRYLGPQRLRERELLDHAITSGQLATDLDIDATLDALCGPIIYRALTGQRIPAKFIDTLVTAILDRHPTTAEDTSAG